MANTDLIHALPKAELHVHIEGTITPTMARQIAAKNNIRLKDDLFAPQADRFQWRDFFHLVTDVYDQVAAVMRTRQDYADITYDYLRRAAAENTLYVEISCWCTQADMIGLPYAELLGGIADGIDRARDEFGIEARIITTLVRHQPLEKLWDEARAIAATPHPYLVGLDVAGGERDGDIPQFAPLFDHIEQNFGHALGLRLHAGESAGPRNVEDALSLAARPTRLGHGVRAAEDTALLSALVLNDITLEVCPTSNILAGIYPSYAQHSLHQIIKSDVAFTLNSDDPGLFGNSIGHEYQIGHDEFGLSVADLESVTRRAIEASFADPALKKILRSRLEKAVPRAAAAE